MAFDSSANMGQPVHLAMSSGHECERSSVLPLDFDRRRTSEVSTLEAIRVTALL